MNKQRRKELERAKSLLEEAMAESLLSNFGRMFGNDDIGEIQAEEAARVVDRKILEERNK